MASVFSCNGVNITLFNSLSVSVARQGWLRRAVSRTLERVGGRWLSVARRLSDIFCSDLHFAFFCCTFAVGKGVRKCFLFLLNSPQQDPQKTSLRDPQPPKGGFSNQLWVAIRPQRLSERASLALSSGPSGLLSVAVLQGRSGRVRVLMGRMRQMGQVYLVEQMGVGKSRVRLFRNLNKFMTIPSGNPLSACGERGTGIFVSSAPFAGKNTLRRIIRIMRMQLAEQFVSSAPFADKNILRRMVWITRMPFEK